MIVLWLLAWWVDLDLYHLRDMDVDVRMLYINKQHCWFSKKRIFCIQFHHKPLLRGMRKESYVSLSLGVNYWIIVDKGAKASTASTGQVYQFVWACYGPRVCYGLSMSTNGISWISNHNNTNNKKKKKKKKALQDVVTYYFIFCLQLTSFFSNFWNCLTPFTLFVIFTNCFNL